MTNNSINNQEVNNGDITSWVEKGNNPIIVELRKVFNDEPLDTIISKIIAPFDEENFDQLNKVSQVGEYIGAKDGFDHEVVNDFYDNIKSILGDDINTQIFVERLIADNFKRGYFYHSIGDLKKANIYYTNDINTKLDNNMPCSFSLLYNQAQMAFSQKKYESASMSFLELLSRDDRVEDLAGEINKKLFLSYLYNGSFEQATNLFNDSKTRELLDTQELAYFGTVINLHSTMQQEPKELMHFINERSASTQRLSGIDLFKNFIDIHALSDEHIRKIDFFANHFLLELNLHNKDCNLGIGKNKKAREIDFEGLLLSELEKNDHETMQLAAMDLLHMYTFTQEYDKAIDFFNKTKDKIDYPYRTDRTLAYILLKLESQSEGGFVMPEGARELIEVIDQFATEALETTNEQDVIDELQNVLQVPKILKNNDEGVDLESVVNLKTKFINFEASLKLARKYQETGENLKAEATLINCIKSALGNPVVMQEPYFTLCVNYLDLVTQRLPQKLPDSIKAIFGKTIEELSEANELDSIINSELLCAKTKMLLNYYAGDYDQTVEIIYKNENFNDRTYNIGLMMLAEGKYTLAENFFNLAIHKASNEKVRDYALLGKFVSLIETENYDKAQDIIVELKGKISDHYIGEIADLYLVYFFKYILNNENILLNNNNISYLEVLVNTTKNKLLEQAGSQCLYQDSFDKWISTGNNIYLQNCTNYFEKSENGNNINTIDKLRIFQSYIYITENNISAAKELINKVQTKFIGELEELKDLLTFQILNYSVLDNCAIAKHPELKNILEKFAGSEYPSISNHAKLLLLETDENFSPDDIVFPDDLDNVIIKNKIASSLASKYLFEEEDLYEALCYIDKIEETDESNIAVKNWLYINYYMITGEYVKAIECSLRINPNFFNNFYKEDFEELLNENGITKKQEFKLLLKALGNKLIGKGGKR